MEKIFSFSLKDLIKYFLSGPIFCGFLAYYDNAVWKYLVSVFPAVVFPLFILVLGVLFYFIYRPLIFETAILRLQDFLRIETESYRTFFKKRYGISTAEAAVLMDDVTENITYERYEKNWGTVGVAVEGAGIHMVYMVSIFSLIFSLLSIANHNINKFIVLFLISMISFTASFLNQRRYEDMELRFIKGANIMDIDLYAMQLFNREAIVDDETKRNELE